MNFTSEYCEKVLQAIVYSFPPRRSCTFFLDLLSHAVITNYTYTTHLPQIPYFSLFMRFI